MLVLNFKYFFIYFKYSLDYIFVIIEFAHIFTAAIFGNSNKLVTSTHIKLANSFIKWRGRSCNINDLPRTVSSAKRPVKSFEVVMSLL